MRLWHVAGDGRYGTEWTPHTFLGRPATFSPGPWLIAHRTGALLLPTFVLRPQHGCKYRVIIETPLSLPYGADAETFLQAGSGRLCPPAGDLFLPLSLAVCPFPLPGEALHPESGEPVFPGLSGRLSGSRASCGAVHRKVMKLLLVQPYLGRPEPPVFPLGLACLAAHLQGHELRAVDLNITPSPAAALRQALAEARPEAVLLSLRNVDTTWYGDPFYYFPRFQEQVRQIRAWAPHSRIIVGGSGFSIFAQGNHGPHSGNRPGLLRRRRGHSPGVAGVSAAPGGFPEPFCPATAERWQAAPRSASPPRMTICLPAMTCFLSPPIWIIPWQSGWRPSGAAP